MEVNKLKHILENPIIQVLSYYIIKGTNVCYMIKLFLKSKSEYILVYIPRNFRFTVEKSEKIDIIFMSEVSDDCDKDDYTQTSRFPEFDRIDTTVSKNLYDETSKKYDKVIHTEEIDEKPERKMKRQVGRLNIPFKNHNYSIAVESINLLSVLIDSRIRTFVFKNFKRSFKNTLFLVKLEDLNSLDIIEHDIGIINTQYYNIIKKASINTLDEMKANIHNYDSLMKTVKYELTSSEKKLIDYASKYSKIKENEEKLLSQLKKKIQTTAGVDKSSFQEQAKRDIDIIYKQNSEISVKVMDIINNYQNILLNIEEISFDTNIMISRIEINMKRLEKIK